MGPIGPKARERAGEQGSMVVILVCCGHYPRVCLALSVDQKNRLPPLEMYDRASLLKTFL